MLNCTYSHTLVITWLKLALFAFKVFMWIELCSSCRSVSSKYLSPFFVIISFQIWHLFSHSFCWRLATRSSFVVGAGDLIFEQLLISLPSDCSSPKLLWPFTIFADFHFSRNYWIVVLTISKLFKCCLGWHSRSRSRNHAVNSVSIYFIPEPK